MHQPSADLEIKALEKMYLKEIEILKRKLLSDDFGNDILKQQNKAIELALLIHDKQTKEPIPCNKILIEEV